jgi:hypothetical protein
MVSWKGPGKNVFELFYGHLVYFYRFWMLYQENLATLACSHLCTWLFRIWSAGFVGKRFFLVIWRSVGRGSGFPDTIQKVYITRTWGPMLWLKYLRKKCWRNWRFWLKMLLLVSKDDNIFLKKKRKTPFCRKVVYITAWLLKYSLIYLCKYT